MNIAVFKYLQMQMLYDYLYNLSNGDLAILLDS